LAEALRDSERPPEEFIPSWIPGLLTDSAPEFLRFGLTSAMSQFHPVGYRAMARALAEADMSDLLPNIDVPTLLVWGEDDLRSPVEVGEQFARTIPGSQLEVIKAAGHVSSLEQPKLFNECARAFWQRLDE
jgi:pimeloyl-ACP methyl ester carboxylesterase